VTAGNAVHLAALQVADKARKAAATLLEAAEDDLEFKDGWIQVKGVPELKRSLGEVARALGGVAGFALPAGLAPGLAAAVDFEPQGLCYTNGTHLAEVEVDIATGGVRILRYVVVHDCGRMLNPVLVEGQVHGGVAQGYGQVFGENAVYDRETGQFLTASFMDYAMPRADWLKGTFTRESHPVPTATNLMGAKGVGESGCSGSLPALMNALMNAVRPAGVQDLQMPVTPVVMWRTLNQTARKAA
jgi:carbon-monoxide dehydrogenase large subunit